MKSYGQTKAVDDVSFDISGGEVFGLLGPNGAGKSTIIRMMTCLTRPDSGTCAISGYDVVQESIRVKGIVGVVPQENNLDREMTVWDNLAIYARLHGVDDRNRRIGEALKDVGLDGRADQLAGSLSGGMKRRLLIARALLPEPQMIFLDEPSIGLDPQIRRQLWDVIRKARIDGKTVVLTTHYIEEAEALCDRVGIMAKGRLIALGTAGELKQTAGAYVVEHVDRDGRLNQQTTRSRDEAHALARSFETEVTVRRTNLEDVFVRLTGGRMD